MKFEINLGTCDDYYFPQNTCGFYILIYSTPSPAGFSVVECLWCKRIMHFFN